MKNENKLIKDSRYAETLVHFYYFNMTILKLTFNFNITYKHLLPEFSEINNCLFEKKNPFPDLQISILQKHLRSSE